MKISVWFSIAVFLSCGFVYAQNPVYKVDQTVILTVTFEGKDASKVTTGSYLFQLAGKSPDDQPNFNTNFTCGDVGQSSIPGTLEISCKVAPNQTRGEYNLSQITATISGIRVTYDESEFPARKITIQNASTLAKPKIKDVQVH